MFIQKKCENMHCYYHLRSIVKVNVFSCMFIFQRRQFTIGPMKMFRLEYETLKQTFIVSYSKRNVFISGFVTVVWESCLVKKINIHVKTFTVERK